MNKEGKTTFSIGIDNAVTESFDSGEVHALPVPKVISQIQDPVVVEILKGTNLNDILAEYTGVQINGLSSHRR